MLALERWSYGETFGAARRDRGVGPNRVLKKWAAKAREAVNNLRASCPPPPVLATVGGCGRPTPPKSPAYAGSGRGRSLASRTKLYAAATMKPASLFLAKPTRRVLRKLPTVLLQPKISSTSLRLR